MMFMRLDQARSLGIKVGTDPNVAMTSGGVVLVHDGPFDEEQARRASLIIDMDGDELYLPPFRVE